VNDFEEQEELTTQQWWHQLEQDEMAIEEFLLLCEETRWQKFTRKLREEVKRWT